MCGVQCVPCMYKTHIITTITGDSLCYAFIGFDSDLACEEAYFKMNNAVIDDRRIKV